MCPSTRGPRQNIVDELWFERQKTEADLWLEWQQEILRMFEMSQADLAPRKVDAVRGLGE